ncbi:hypothetical protein TorRG33x02_203150 [Trema orientale]|uniref:Uncharacterized protein n=1 Tax=Trema orientale TaxID=63057 RepID=A0A2P5EEA3_TREOI|nr:hypothetical protein TorRG33x02_203150 [Trema orientale]
MRARIDVDVDNPLPVGFFRKLESSKVVWAYGPWPRAEANEKLTIAYLNAGQSSKAEGVKLTLENNMEMTTLVVSEQPGKDNNPKIRQLVSSMNSLGSLKCIQVSKTFSGVDIPANEQNSHQFAIEKNAKRPVCAQNSSNLGCTTIMSKQVECSGVESSSLNIQKAEEAGLTMPLASS